MLTLKARRPGYWVEVGVLLAILAAAAFLRFTQLDAVPPGMTHDEAAFGAEAERVLSGERPIYFALGYGHEPLYAYLVAGAFSLLGHTLSALRITSALCGVLVVLGTYLVARRLFGVKVAWISAGWMVVAFWPLSLSRQALRAITLPLLWLPSAWLFWVGWLRLSGQASASEPQSGQEPRRSNLFFLLSGLLLGTTFYTYMASRLTWLVYPLFAAYLLLRRETRAMLKRAWPGLILALVVAGLVAAPLGLYLYAHPGSEKRFDAMLEPVRDLLAGRPERVLRHAWNGVRVFSWVGDRFWVYNVPGRPVFNWTGSALFYGGVLVALWRWRDPRCAYLLIWLVVGLSPALVTTNEGIFLRAIVAQPATYLLVGVGTVAAGTWLSARLPRRWGWAWGVLAVVLAVWEGLRGYQAYFLDWPSHPETRNIYNHNLVTAARYLRDRRDRTPEGEMIGVSAMYPLYYHDPWIWRYVTGRADPDLRWFGGLDPYPGGGVVYPATGEAQYLFSALTSLHPALQASFATQATLVERVRLDPSDQNPYFEIWHWWGQAALDNQLEALRRESPMWVSPEVVFTQPALRRPLEGEAQFSDVVSLIGYQLNGKHFEPGDEVQLVTYWRAIRMLRAQDDWNTFLHLLDGDSQVMGGIDVLHCPPTGWQAGDVVVQLHQFKVREDAPRAQKMYLEIGVYRRTAGRVPVWVDGVAVGDRVLLSPVEIR